MVVLAPNAAWLKATTHQYALPGTWLKFWHGLDRRRLGKKLHKSPERNELTIRRLEMPLAMSKVPGGFAVAHSHVVSETPIPDRKGPEAGWEPRVFQQRAGTFDNFAHDPFGV